MTVQNFKKYLVGGAVRDRLLNRKLDSNDTDWVVVGATPDYFLSKNYKQVGKNFPVFLHPKTKHEYALARTERKIGQGYTGFSVDFNPNITIEEDLHRRDITINSIAQDENFNLIDPFNGQKDIKNRIIRHTSSAFIEDPLRILRLARFYAQLDPWGFQIADETKQLIIDISNSGSIAELTPERVWIEFKKALVSPKPSKFINLLHEIGALKILLPDLHNLYGIPQNTTYHPEKCTGTHIELVLDAGVKLTNDIDIMFGLLVHDLGKGLTEKEHLPYHPQHEIKGVPLVQQVGTRYKLPKSTLVLGKIITEWHGKVHKILAWQKLDNPNFDQQAEDILNFFMKIYVFRQPKRLEKLLIACEADSKGRLGYENTPYPQREFLTKILAKLLTIKIKPLPSDSNQEIALHLRQLRYQKIKTMLVDFASNK